MRYISIFPIFHRNIIIDWYKFNLYAFNIIYSKKERNQVERVEPIILYRFPLFFYFLIYFHECLYKFYYLSIIQTTISRKNSTKLDRNCGDVLFRNEK